MCLFEDHLEEHLELYVEGKLSASQQGILMTNWVGQSWKKNRSFKKCGLSVALNGSENAQVSIDGIPNYEMPPWFVEEEFKWLDDDEGEDKDASENDENNKFDLLTDQQIPFFVERWL